MQIHEEQNGNAQHNEHQRPEYILNAERAVRYAIDVRRAQRLPPISQVRHGHVLAAVSHSRLFVGERNDRFPRKAPATGLVALGIEPNLT